jgi:hypothetical protein
MATKLAPTVQDALDELPDDTLHAAMARAFAEIEAATKDATNPHFKSKYADLSSVIEAIKPALVNNGLFVTQRCAPSDGGVTVDTYVHHKGGNDMFLGSLFVPANKQDAQGFGSALTYCKRYALQTAFVVPTEDDDGNAASRAANDRPTAGEAPPTKRAEDGGNPTGPRLAGDMSDSALRGSIKTLVHNINGCASLREFEELLELQDAVETIEQCKRRFPAWWETGHGCPEGFRPLKKILEETRQGLKDLETA